MAKRLPRGVRNFNPGNVDYNEAQFIRDRWVGEVGLEKHRRARFTTFKTHEHGIRAMTKILLTYHHKRKAADGSQIDTVQEIIDRWAPPVENDTDAYANRVRKLLGVGKGEEIDLDDVMIMLPLLKAIIKHENGQQPYSDKTILRGMEMAGLNSAIVPL